jgi:hypothetical protein
MRPGQQTRGEAYTEIIRFDTDRIRRGGIACVVARLLLLQAAVCLEIRGVHLPEDCVALELAVSGRIGCKVEIGKILDQRVVPPAVEGCVRA